MPKKGFITLTVSEKVYDHFMDSYMANKKELCHRGINSFSAYIRYNMEQALMKTNPTVIEKISIDKQRAILQDNRTGGIVVVRLDPIFCESCKKDTCSHVGYAYSIPEAYPLKS